MGGGVLMVGVRYLFVELLFMGLFGERFEVVCCVDEVVVEV